MGSRRAQAIQRSERGAEAFAQARRHSRRVRMLKFVLPAAALLVSALFLGYSLRPSTLGGGKIDLGTASIEDGNLVMANPTLEGFTEEDLPYTMTAARARQPIGTPTGAIDLEEINATVPIDEDNQAVISAAAGTFDRQNERLTLNGEVVLETTSGLVARLRSADVNMADRSLTTDEPVEIDMNGMHIEAETFRASNGGGVLVFERRVRMEIDPAQVRRTQGEEGESQR